MYKCEICGETFKTSQGRAGHKMFKHQSKRVPIKIKRAKGIPDAILVDDEVIGIKNLTISFHLLVRLNKLREEWGYESLEDLIDELVSETEDFIYIECINCGKKLWIPLKGKFYCVWCGWKLNIGL